MKKILILICVVFFLSCKSDDKSVKIAVSEASEPFPKFNNLKEMFDYSSDFNEEDGSLKFISDDNSNLHIQVSKPISIKDLEDVKNDIVKRDIVYVAFQTFALTDVNELTVTAVPSELENQKKYFDTYRKSIKIDREKARFVLKKYIGTENFQSLYKMEGTIWIPSDNFSVLKFEKLKDVFEDLQK